MFPRFSLMEPALVVMVPPPLVPIDPRFVVMRALFDTMFPARLERRESEIAGLAQSAARTPPSPPRGGRSSPARTLSPARRADPSEAGSGADLNC